MASVRGHRGDADVKEVVGVTQVFAQPLQRCLQERLDAVDHHLEVFLLTCTEEGEVEEEEEGGGGAGGGRGAHGYLLILQSALGILFHNKSKFN